VYHNYCVSQLLCITTTVYHNYRVSQLPCITTTVYHNYRVSQLLCITTTVYHNYCVSQLLCITTTVYHNYCVSQLLCITTQQFDMSWWYYCYLKLCSREERYYDRRGLYKNTLIYFKNLKVAQNQWHNNTTKHYFISFYRNIIVFRFGLLSLHGSMCVYVRDCNSLLSTMQNMSNLWIIFYLTYKNKKLLMFNCRYWIQ